MCHEEICTEISHLSNPNPLSYSGEQTDPSEKRFFWLPSHRSARSLGPNRPLTPLQQRFRSVSAQSQPLPPRIASFSPGRRLNHAAPTAAAYRSSTTPLGPEHRSRPGRRLALRAGDSQVNGRPVRTEDRTSFPIRDGPVGVRHTRNGRSGFVAQDVKNAVALSGSCSVRSSWRTSSSDGPHSEVTGP